MKKLTVILILIGFFFLTGCIVKKQETQKAVAPEKTESAKVTSPVPQRVEPRRDPFTKPAMLTKLEVENEALKKQLTEIETLKAEKITEPKQKPEDVVRLEAKIDELKKEIEAVETLLKQDEFQPHEIQKSEPEYLPETQAREPEEGYAAYTPLVIYDICPSFFPLLRLRFYPFLPWYPGIFAWIEWCDWYYWDYYYPRRYYYRSIFAGYYDYCYDRIGYYGQTTVHKNQLQNRRTLTNNGRITTNVTSDQFRSLSKSPHGISPISKEPVNQNLKSNSLKTYPSRIDSSKITAHQDKTTAVKTSSNSGRFESPWGHLGASEKSVASGSSSRIYPNRRSSPKSPTTESLRGPSPKSFSKSPSGSFRSSSGSFRSSSRPAPSRSSSRSSVRRK